MSSRPVISENEWICGGSRCQQVNNGSRTSCEYCGRSKPRGKGQVGHEIGKEAAEKSKGLFAAEDWSCSKCGNINWARRLQCNICNAAKCGEVEARTGYGGGYMDRQQVEHRRNESDDEYDHFGRRKKRGINESDSRRSVRDESPRSERSNGRVEQDDNESDDEDDEDDDEESGSDLAKYDLVDFTDEPESKTAERDGEKNLESSRTVVDKKGDSHSLSNDTSSSELSSASSDRSNSVSSHSSSAKGRRRHKGNNRAAGRREVVAVAVSRRRHVAEADRQEVGVVQQRNVAGVDAYLTGVRFVRRVLSQHVVQQGNQATFKQLLDWHAQQEGIVAF
uniref:Zinc finger Ran-binding domain-containing protein 2 n=1 Tax=Trichuris muris TaxID=70415 RepID=A0A5S6QQK8_TRIMR